MPHAYGAGNTIVEFALPETFGFCPDFPFVEDIDILVDINDAVFLPGDYLNDRPYNLNLLNEWTLLDRLDPAPGQSPPEYELYGHYESGTYYLKVKTDGTVIGPNTTIWLDTDQNPSTGHAIWAWLGGFDFNINVHSDGKPYLYTGAAAQSFVSGPLGHEYSGLNSVIEIALPEALIGTSVGDIDILMDINNAVFLPGDYANDPPNTLNSHGFSERTDFSKRVGIVFSQTTSDNFFNDKAYAQLFQAM